MLSKSFPLFVLSVLGLFFVVFGDLGTVPGNAGWSGSLGFKTNVTSSIRYATIPQTVTNQEWKNLGTTFTIETWFLVNAPASEPLGRWNASTAATGEPQFLPLIVRHPGQGFTNQWAHFSLQLTRTLGGIVVAAHSGCGCAVPPMIFNGSQVDLSNCGFGYKLNSDNNKTIGGPIYIIPNTWYHVAISMDGDNTDWSKTRTASLYINGVLVLTNTWADPANQPRSANASACVDKPMQWYRDFGSLGQISIGYLDNQDFNSGRIVQNSDPAWNFYGFDGLIDEIRIWRNVRTAAQIADNFDIELTPQDLADDNLVALYNFNDGPYVSGTPLFANVKTGNLPTGNIVVGNSNATAAYSFWQSSGLTNALLNIKTKVWTRGTLPSSPRMVLTNFTLPVVFTIPVGNPTTTPVLATSFVTSPLMILSFSPLLSTNLGVNSAAFSDPVGAPVSYSSVVAAGQQLQVYMRCGDVQCSNLAGAGGDPLTSFPWRSLYLTYNGATTTNNLTSQVYFHVYPDCDGLYDACGICNGDNRTCQCVVYHEFKNVRMSYVLLTFMVDFLIDKVTTTTQILDETLDKVNNLIATNTAIPTAADQTSQLMSFYNGCLTNYCQSVTRFLQLLVSTNAPLP